MLLSPNSARFKGIIINNMRGQASDLQEGIEELNA